MSYLFSVISPMYNVERYLSDFFASLERQTFGFDRLQLILVDDGSTDGTLARAEALRRRHPANVIVVTKENGGQASARNEGLSHATGEWVTFPDPDDKLDHAYFAEVARLIGAPKERPLTLVSGRMLLWYERAHLVRDSHALAFRFAAGNRVIDLDQSPEYVQAHVTTGFLLRAEVERAGLRFDERLRLRFEDGNFVTRYLLGQTERVVGLAATAKYHYRQRDDGSSTIQSSVADPRKYTDTIRFGFLPIIARCRDLGTTLPRWAQNLMLYDTFWIFRASQGREVRSARFPEPMHKQVEELLAAFLEDIDEHAILDFKIMPTSPGMRDALWLMKTGRSHAELRFRGEDRVRGLARYSYVYRGKRPQESLRLGGEPADARYVKDQPIEYAGAPVGWERSLWVAREIDVRFELNGLLQSPVSTVARSASARNSRAAAIRRRLSQHGWLARFVKRNLSRSSLTKLATMFALGLPALSAPYEDAWVFIDRDVDANDSAEILYRWMARERPEVNSYFVVRKSTPDWRRLRAEGFRLIPYGTVAFNLLMLKAIHVASSHADRFISDPVPRALGAPRPTFTFLQHGVIKGDISSWLNPKEVSVFVTSTQDEYDYITGPSPFRYGPKEVRLTGLPRFDDLLSQEVSLREEDRRLILIMPTWRDYLTGGMQRTSADRAKVGAFSESAYRTELQALLQSDELRRASEDGISPVFMPHPNMRNYLADFRIPPHVQVRTYADVDVRSLIVRAKLLITDYSSVAFNIAYLRRPTIYFQFDAEEYFTSHTEAPGYFDYELHGFGPVVKDLPSLEKQVRSILCGGIEKEYLQRMERTFPVRDGRSCSRVYDAMIEARTMRSLEERVRRAQLDSWDASALSEGHRPPPGYDVLGR